VRKKNPLLPLLFLLVVQLFVPQTVQAADSCVDWGIEITEAPPHNFAEGTINSYTIGVKNLNNEGAYSFTLDGDKLLDFTPSNGTASIAITSSKYPQAFLESTGIIKNKIITLGNSVDEKCDLWNYRVTNDVISASCTLTYEQDGFKNPSCVDIFSPVTISVDDFVRNGGPLTSSEEVSVYWARDGISLDLGYTKVLPFTVGPGQNIDLTVTPDNAAASSHISVYTGGGLPGETVTWCSASNIQVIEQPCSDEQRNEGNGTSIPFDLCQQISEADAKGKCTDCAGDGGIWTAIGCVKTDANGIVSSFFTVGMGIAGGIALLMILVAAFMFSTSQGEPKRTSEAKEIMQAAVIGLLFIIFSITILQFIGVTILHIPGFGE
jgi:hypothetical protein